MRRTFIEFKGTGGRLIVALDSIIVVGKSLTGSKAFVDVGNGEPYVVEHEVDEVIALMRKADEADARNALEKTAL